MTSLKTPYRDSVFINCPFDDENRFSSRAAVPSADTRSTRIARVEVRPDCLGSLSLSESELSEEENAQPGKSLVLQLNLGG